MSSFKSKLAMFEASATKGVKKPQKAKNSKIKYEGEYVNGIKEGKGKEYLGDKLLFEGEFSQGKRWNGKIKEYDSNGVLLFDGEYKEGEKSGVAKEYKLDGELKFEGVYKQGKRWNGNGIEYYGGKIVFEGIYNEGKKWDGKGKEYDHNDKLTFEGEYKEGIKFGKEYEYKGNLMIEYECNVEKKRKKDKRIFE